MTASDTRKDWNTPTNSVWWFEDDGAMVKAQVHGKFEAGGETWVNLRDPDTDRSLGNAPIVDLGERVTQ